MPRARCSVCDSPHVLAINTMIAARETYTEIERQTRLIGAPIKRETLAKHFKGCLNNQTPEMEQTDLATIDKMDRAYNETPEQRDFAALVQKRAIELLEAGEIRVTATHGLQAQALLDRRAEKVADRTLAVNIARLLSGAMVPVPVNVIEGSAYEVSLLAPPEVVEVK